MRYSLGENICKLYIQQKTFIQSYKELSIVRTKEGVKIGIMSQEGARNVEQVNAYKVE